MRRLKTCLRWVGLRLSHPQDPARLGAVGASGATYVANVNYSGMPADTVDSIAAKTAGRVERVFKRAEA